MSDNDDLETRLSGLSLARTPEDLARSGRALLRHQQIQPHKHWAVRLNYALAASLLLSVGFNLLQLDRRHGVTETAASQCEVGSQSAALFHPDPAAAPVLHDSRHFLPSSTAQLC